AGMRSSTWLCSRAARIFSRVASMSVGSTLRLSAHQDDFDSLLVQPGLGAVELGLRAVGLDLEPALLERDLGAQDVDRQVERANELMQDRLAKQRGRVVQAQGTGGHPSPPESPGPSPSLRAGLNPTAVRTNRGRRGGFPRGPRGETPPGCILASGRGGVKAFVRAPSSLV